MKKLIISILIIFSVSNLFAQDRALDSLKILLNKEISDTGRVNLLINIGGRFGFGQAKNDSSFWYLQQALNLSKKMKYVKGEIIARYQITSFLTLSGNYLEALKMALYNLKLAKQFKEKKILFLQTRQTGWIYAYIGDYKKELEYEKQLSSLVHSGIYKDNSVIKLYNLIANNCISGAYSDLNMPDSALYYEGLNYKFSTKNKNPNWLALSTSALGDLYFNTGNYDSAFFFYKMSYPYAVKVGRRDLVTGDALGIARLFNKKGRPDSAFFYARQSLKVVQTTNDPDDLLHVYSLLSKLYHKVHGYDSAYIYLQDFVNLKDSLFDQNKIAKAQNFAFNETLRQQQIIQAKKEARQLYKNKLKVYILVAVILVFLIIAILLLRNVRNKRKANVILGRQKEEIQKALSELKSTQAQLIQSEKMASLGELTAGIAHEIQNPLNFVNNFSEVSTELLEEMKEEIEKGNLEEVNALIEDVIHNLEKILHHGKRADGIVKGMLQHSRGSSGEKVPTDINALADEYLRLSYHGLRAKDKSFNADFKLEADKSLPKIEVVPQDIGRVLLNLINNAFYAVSEKAGQNRNGYKPLVIVSTKNQGNKVEICVKDNGNGIPESIKEKIFQPFFTTKPTGSGTGLGLSLSYDIIKAHGGELKVETKESEGTVFIITLNLNSASV